MVSLQSSESRIASYGLSGPEKVSCCISRQRPPFSFAMKHTNHSKRSGRDVSSTVFIYGLSHLRGRKFGNVVTEGIEKFFYDTGYFMRFSTDETQFGNGEGLETLSRE